MNKIFNWWFKIFVKIVIFINYSTKNHKEALEIEKIFNGVYGVVVFKAPSSIEPGSISNKDIINNIKNCDIFIPIISSASVQSTITQHEIGIALDAKKDIFPIILGNLKDKDLGLLTDRQYIKYKDKNLKKRLGKRILSIYLKGLIFWTIVLVILIYFKFFRI